MNETMNKLAEGTSMWNSFEDVKEMPSEENILFSATYNNIDLIVEKPFAEFDEDGFYPDDDWKIVIRQDVNTVALVSDRNFIEFIKGELKRRFDVPDELLNGVNSNDLLAQGNNYVALECSSELTEWMNSKNLAVH